MDYRKADPVRLRDVGKDEKWLQDRIAEDTSILGLGDLTLLQRELTQTTGGRIDLLMYDPEESVRYEIEVMLGALDESHIIRTIEYWDIERRRFPGLEHRAVIVAEDITNRFFNILSLMNKAIPVVAIQLSAFRSEEHLFLNFVKVLDLADLSEEEYEEPQEPVDRRYWETRANSASLRLADTLLAIVKVAAEPKITYTRGYLAVATSGRQFLWIHPRKAARVYLDLRVGESRDEIMTKLQDQGLDCDKRPNREGLKMKLTPKEFEQAKDLIKESILLAEGNSH